jgi:hypothetical protein
MELKRVFALQQDFVSHRKTQFYIDRIGAAAQRFATILAQACRNSLIIR